MAIAPIELWLRSPDYTSGAALYQRYGANAFLRDCFAAQSLPLDRLVAELKAISDLSVEADAPTPAFGSRRRIVQADASLPPLLQALDAKWKRHYAQADALHRDLLHTASPKERRRMCATILQEMDIVRDIWYQIQYFRETGEVYAPPLAEPVVVAAESLLETIAKTKNLPTYITKLKKKVPGIFDAEQLQEALASIAAHEAQLAAAWNRLQYLNTQIQSLGL
jgi:hypothetical protein